MKVSKNQTILSLLLCFTPTLLGLYLWNDLPQLIPSHFNFNGEINGYQSREFMVFHLPILLAFLNLFLLNRMKKEVKYLPHIAIWLIPVLLNTLLPFSYYISLNEETPFIQVLFILIGILFIIVGNYLPKTRHNYYFGIRTPQTLKNEDNWNYTHRIGGIVFIIYGFLITISAFFQNYSLIGFFTISAFIILIALSIRYEKKERKN